MHVDGTMRPRIVSPSSHPWLHAVLGAFRELTGVGVLFNRPFNCHGTPIVGATADVLEPLHQGWVDGVVIGPYYVVRKG